MNEIKELHVMKGNDRIEESVQSDVVTALSLLSVLVSEIEKEKGINAKKILDTVRNAIEMREREPVVQGKWKLYGNDDDSGMSYWCTVCNFHLSEDLFYSGYKNGRWIENGVFKYCPNCGAKMEVEP